MRLFGGLCLLTLLLLGWMLVLKEAYDLILLQEQQVIERCDFGAAKHGPYTPESTWVEIHADTTAAMENYMMELEERDGLSAREYWEAHNQED